MAKRIVIIGGLPIDHDRSALLEALCTATGTEYEWEWFKATERDGWRVPPEFLNKFRWAVQQKPPAGQRPPIVVMLRSLRGDNQNAVFKLISEPVLAPDHIQDSTQLVDWLLS